jgi:hypothetical protein
LLLVVVRRLVNIGPSDIHSGNLKLIMGLLWTIIYHYQVGVAVGKQPEKIPRTKLDLGMQLS